MNYKSYPVTFENRTCSNCRSNDIREMPDGNLVCIDCNKIIKLIKNYNTEDKKKTTLKEV